MLLEGPLPAELVSLELVGCAPPGTVEEGLLVVASTGCELPGPLLGVLFGKPDEDFPVVG